MGNEFGRFDYTKILRYFAKGEVKTPLGFFFKVFPYLTAAYIAILYAPISEDLKKSLLFLVTGVFGALCILIGIFTWFKPTNLIYGESSHRSERKLELGTERKSIDDDDVMRALKVPNPKVLHGRDG
ncbi:MAG: hypothetical protein HY650_06020 [Acidobacteria bacterium]|nr:hypothetical protein [Acidobacteriota bacterium]